MPEGNEQAVAQECNPPDVAGLESDYKKRSGGATSTPSSLREDSLLELHSRSEEY